MTDFNYNIFYLEGKESDIDNLKNYKYLNLRYKISSNNIENIKMNNILTKDLEIDRQRFENANYENFIFLIFSLYELIEYCEDKSPFDIKEKKYFELKNNLLDIIKNRLIELVNETFEECIKFYLQNIDITLINDKNTYKFISLITAIFFLFYFDCSGKNQFNRCNDPYCQGIYVYPVSKKDTGYCSNECYHRHKSREYNSKKRKK